MDKIPMIHNLGKEDLIRSIKELSVSYTPHWRFDPDNPDIGTALGMIFADMQADTLRRYSELPLNCLLYTLRAHETVLDLVCRLLLEKKKVPNITLIVSVLK